MGSSDFRQSGADVVRNFYDMMQSGVLIYKDNHLCLPGEIASLICESRGYMADYVIGTDGRVSEIRFDRVTDRPKC